MRHELGPILRTVNIRRAFLVYKSYDGNAPDGPVFATCATPELAEEVRSFLENNDPHGEFPETEEEREVAEISWPYVEGWEFAASWVAKEGEAEEDKIATTADEAWEQVTRV